MRTIILKKNDTTLIIERIDSEGCDVLIRGGSLDGSEFVSEFGLSDTMWFYLNQGYHLDEVVR